MVSQIVLSLFLNLISVSPSPLCGGNVTEISNFSIYGVSGPEAAKVYPLLNLAKNNITSPGIFYKEGRRINYEKIVVCFVDMEDVNSALFLGKKVNLVAASQKNIMYLSKKRMEHSALSGDITHELLHMTDLYDDEVTVSREELEICLAQVGKGREDLCN